MILGVRIVEDQQGAGVTGGQHACRHPALNRAGQVEQPQGVGDMRPGAADLPGQLLMGGTEVIQQLLVGRGLFQRVKLLAVQVLHESVAQQVIIRGGAHDGRDIGQARALRGAPPPLSHDQLEPARTHLADHHRLQQPDLADRLD